MRLFIAILIAPLFMAGAAHAEMSAPFTKELVDYPLASESGTAQNQGQHAYAERTQRNGAPMALPEGAEARPPCPSDDAEADAETPPAVALPQRDAPRRRGPPDAWRIWPSQRL